MSKVGWWIFCLVLIGPLAHGTPPTDPSYVVQQVLRRDHLLQERRKTFDYDLDELKQKLSANEGVLSVVEKKSVIIGDRRPEYVSKDQNSPARPTTGAGEKEQPFSMLKIIDHFNYSLETIEEVNGVSCYRIKFTPKKDQPYHNRQEKVMNQVTGRLWASTQDFSLVKNEGHLLQPTAVGWIFATLREMEFHYESQRLPNGDFGPKKISYTYLVDIPFGQIHERVIRTITNYRSSKGDH